VALYVANESVVHVIEWHYRRFVAGQENIEVVTSGGQRSPYNAQIADNARKP
jgi:hypothetical protein